MHHEINIDCLSGPTHHFGGLAFGNIASTGSKGTLSNPKLSALQGLEKMRLIADLGIPQIVLPPYPRPDFEALKNLGYAGTEQEIVETVFQTDPELFLQVSSSSAMWMANAATVSPSSDTLDGKLHLTPANLASNFHRTLEVPTTTKLLQQLFSSSAIIHKPLPSAAQFFDEGAANHTRFITGLHLFVHGPAAGTKKYPARQTRAAQEAIARIHHLPAQKVAFLEQNPEAIDAGCFHNDVISTGFENLFLYHEKAFLNFHDLDGIDCIKITEAELSLQKAVESYFFNSQIVRSHKKLILICPEECRTLAFLKRLTVFDEILFVDLHESMKNGGGPACLRLRVQLSAQELEKIPKNFLLTPALYSELKSAIESSYPDSLTMQNLLDPIFRESCKEATIRIHSILKSTIC